jgi:serine/threonine protein kinase/tetratricopeptide (TPR) repeat protein
MDELSLFTAAIAINDPGKRAAFLDRECADQPGLRAQLDKLLAEHGHTQPALDSPQYMLNTIAQVTEDFPGNDTHAGTIVDGKYSLVESIGEGGMGTVWRAKQSEPVKRFVALKLIKAGMDSKQVLTRFEAERQALALMDHPSIAKVLDGGLHQGRPYFVMELVKGTPITDFCDARKLTPKERLELFVPVCQAIQHAHQKGIIHRDIKPSNVLVALYDDQPIPKVIDFGVAKATGGTLTEATIDTGFGGVVGTPQYMSPEQATLNNLDIDTRSDVYALGVLLYELLTGSTPFTKKELAEKGLLEILRVVREEEPPRPSTKLSTADALPSIAATRGTEPGKLTGLLRNELDWIVMKALEKDRSRRYETANGFATDISRYLAGEAVVAHPPSTGYRVKKFVLRHRGQVVAGALLVLSLLGGVAGTSIGLLLANERRIEADEARMLEKTRADEESKAKREALLASENARQAKNIAEARLTQVESGIRLIGSIFERSDPFASGNDDKSLQLMIGTRLDHIANQLRQNTIGDNLTVARLEIILGKALDNLGYERKAIPLLNQALAILADRLGEDHDDTITCISNLACSLGSDGQYLKAVPLHRKALTLSRKKYGVNDTRTIRSISNLALVLQKVDQVKEAQLLLEEAVRLVRQTNDWPQLRVFVLCGLASNYREYAGRAVDSLELAEEALQFSKRVLGEENTTTLHCLATVSRILTGLDRLDKALAIQVETVQRFTRILGPDHQTTLEAMDALAQIHAGLGHTNEAKEILEEAVRLSRRRYGPDHPSTVGRSENLASIYFEMKILDRSVPMFEDVYRWRKQHNGPDHPETLFTQINLGMNYRDVGRHDDAIRNLEEAYRKGGTRPELAWVGNRLVNANIKAGRLHEAAKLQHDVAKNVRKVFQPHSAELAEELKDLGKNWIELSDFVAAEPFVRESISIYEKTPNSTSLPIARTLLGAAMLGQKRYAEAEPLLLQGIVELKKHSPDPKSSVYRQMTKALDNIIELYAATNKPDELKKYQALRAMYPNVEAKK